MYAVSLHNFFVNGPVTGSDARWHFSNNVGIVDEQLFVPCSDLFVSPHLDAPFGISELRVGRVTSNERVNVTTVVRVELRLNPISQPHDADQRFR